MTDIFFGFLTVRALSTLNPPRGLSPNLGPDGVSQKLDQDIPIASPFAPDELCSSADVAQMCLSEIATPSCSLI